MNPFLSAIHDPQSAITSGSPVWQIAFISFAAVLILFEIVRGWRLGLLRQVVRIIAVVAAYGAAFFGSRLFLPLLRPFVKAPDIVISAVAGALLAIIVYSVITSLGAILFKRTNQQNSGAIRLLYGLSGGALGILFGAFLVWLMVVGIRAIGSIAEAETRLQASRVAFSTYERPKSESDPTLRIHHKPTDESASLMISLVRLKNSIELGTVGNAVKTTDVVPTSTYQTLGKVGQVLSNPESAQRLLNYPGAKELTKNPRIIALRDDPEIFRMIQEGRLLDLLQDPRIIDALNDPALAAQFRDFQFQRALEYAMKRQ